MQRADSAHLAWVSCVPFGFLPRADRGARAPGRATAADGRAALAGAGVLLLLFAHPPLHVPQLRRLRRCRRSAATGSRTRSTTTAASSTTGDPDVAAVMPTNCSPTSTGSREPGERLFVGTGDLRKTPYSEAYLYYLLPDLVPATYYIEMDPGVANAPGSRPRRRPGRRPTS